MPIRTPTTKAGKKAAVHTVMHEYKAGKLHSGSKTGPRVTNPEQAVAIAMSESGQSNKKPRHTEVAPVAPGTNYTPQTRHPKPPSQGSHGYGHAAPQRSGHLRTSGSSGAHRIGRR